MIFFFPGYFCTTNSSGKSNLNPFCTCGHYPIDSLQTYPFVRQTFRDLIGYILCH